MHCFSGSRAVKLFGSQIQVKDPKEGCFFVFQKVWKHEESQRILQLGNIRTIRSLYCGMWRLVLLKDSLLWSFYYQTKQWKNLDSSGSVSHKQWVQGSSRAARLDDWTTVEVRLRWLWAFKACVLSSKIHCDEKCVIHHQRLRFVSLLFSRCRCQRMALERAKASSLGKTCHKLRRWTTKTNKKKEEEEEENSRQKGRQCKAHPDTS